MTQQSTAARDDTMAYVATAPCGCIHGIDTENSRETTKQVADWIKRGSTVDRRLLSEIQMVWDCPHDPQWGRT